MNGIGFKGYCILIQNLVTGFWLLSPLLWITLPESSYQNPVSLFQVQKSHASKMIFESLFIQSGNSLFAI